VKEADSGKEERKHGLRSPRSTWGRGEIQEVEKVTGVGRGAERKSCKPDKLLLKRRLPRRMGTLPDREEHSADAWALRWPFWQERKRRFNNRLVAYGDFTMKVQKDRSGKKGTGDSPLQGDEGRGQRNMTCERGQKP